MRAPLSLSVLMLAGTLTACGSSTYADVAGTFDGAAFTPQAYYWGGPFVVFTSEVQDCIDMSWVRKGFVDGDTVELSRDLRALQFTYNEGDVVEGTYSVEGNAPVAARFLSITAGAVDASVGRTGSLLVSDITGQDHLVGSFQIGFDEGNLTGDFEVENCNNLKSKS